MPSPDLRARLGAIDLLVFDVDGVLTDGTLSGPDQGGRRWHVADGFGFYLARRAGLKLAFLSGKDHPELRARAETLGVALLRLGRVDKGAALREILTEAEREPAQALFAGDDLFDLPAMAVCGVSACPADARDELRERADWVLASPGGRGAAREIIEGVLKARGLWSSLTAPFLGGEHA